MINTRINHWGVCFKNFPSDENWRKIKFTLRQHLLKWQITWEIITFWEKLSRLWQLWLRLRWRAVSANRKNKMFRRQSNGATSVNLASKSTDTRRNVCAIVSSGIQTLSKATYVVQSSVRSWLLMIQNLIEKFYE